MSSGARSVARLAAGANVILSALIRGAAHRVFQTESLDIATAEFTLDEVREYLPELAEKRNLPL